MDNERKIQSGLAASPETAVAAAGEILADPMSEPANPALEPVNPAADPASVLEPTAQTETTEETIEAIADNVKVLSPGRLMLKRFFRSKLSIAGLVMILALFLFSFLGPVFTPYGEVEVDYEGGIDIVPIEVTYTVTDEAGNLVTYTMYDVSYSRSPINVLAQPSGKHLLGTDDQGRDVLARLMYGGRISLAIGFIVVILETLIGVILGGVAGYFGKWVDQLIMRIVDVIACVPQLPILLIFSALIEFIGVPEKMRIYYLMVILTFFGWAGVARLVRGQILTLREQEFMVAAEATGLPIRRKIFRHLIPNVMPQLIVSMTLGLGGVILMESTLSFLGLGVPLPYAAWGTMIGRIQSFDILVNHFHLWGPPGVCIMLAVLGFNFLGDSLRDALDPKMKR